MGCRQSKENSDRIPQQNSTLTWLAALGLQQYYAAFYQAGYGNLHTLEGLTDNHLNVIEQGCHGGLPAEHRRVILSAARHLTASQSSQATEPGAPAAPNAKSLPVFEGISSLPRSVKQPEADSQAAPLEASLQATTAESTASHAVHSSMPSFVSIASSSSNANSTVEQRQASTVGSSTAAPAGHALQQEHTRPAAQGKPAPSQSQLQKLYSQMEADYKKLQDRPAHARASAHPPLHGGAPIQFSSSRISSQHQDSGITADKQFNSHSAAAVPASLGKATPSKDQARLSIPQGLNHIQAAAGISLSAAGLQQARPSLPGNRAQQQSVSRASAGNSGHRLSGADANTHRADRRLGRAGGRLKADQVKSNAAGAERVSAAAAIKQMRQETGTRFEEPFVQVFTNFHTLSKGARPAEMPPVEQQPQLPLGDQAGLLLQQQRSEAQPQLIAAQHPPQVQYNPTDPNLQVVSSHSPNAHPQPRSPAYPSQGLVMQACSNDLHCMSQSLSSQQESCGQPGWGEVHTQDLPQAFGPSTDMLNGHDQYKLLRHQQSLIPKQSQSSLAVLGQNQMPVLQHQYGDQSQFEQSVTHKAAFAAAAVSYQTPQALSKFESASQHDSIAVQQASGHVMMQSKSQFRQHSMHHQLNPDQGSQPNAMYGAPARQDEGLRAGQQQPYDMQWPSSRAAEEQPYSRQGRQQPCNVTAMRQQHMAEHTVSRSADGNTSYTVSSSSSHSEFSFRRSGASPVVPKTDAAVRPSLQGGAGSAAAEALRVIRAAKQHRHGPAFLTAAPVPPHVGRGEQTDQIEVVRQQMMHMDAQIRQRVQQLQQCL